MALPLRWWPVLLALAAPGAPAATACPLIRPAGLTPQRVDDAVAMLYAQGLHEPLRKLAITRSFKSQHAGDEELADYEEATRTVGEALGFDAREAFAQAARAQGSGRPDESLTIAELQALARSTYAQGPDAPAPAASSGVSYVVSGIPVQVPETPAQGWMLVRCSHRDVTFMRLGDGRFFAASLRRLTANVSDEEEVFLQDIEAALRFRLPASARPRTWKVVADAAGRGNCTEASVDLRPKGHGGSFLLRSRVCAAVAGRPQGYAILYGQYAPAGADLDTRAAEDFISATAPK